MSTLRINFKGSTGKPTRILEGVSKEEFLKASRNLSRNDPLLIRYEAAPGVAGLFGTDNTAEISDLSWS